MRKEIQSHPDYIISSVGYVIKKSTGKRMATTLTEDGYVIVRLTQNGKIKRLRLHRLVALHFVPNPENKPEVNHKDGNKLNCKKRDEYYWQKHHRIHVRLSIKQTKP